jgi:hypothetical protein
MAFRLAKMRLAHLDPGNGRGPPSCQPIVALAKITSIARPAEAAQQNVPGRPGIFRIRAAISGFQDRLLFLVISVRIKTLQ